MTSWIFTYCVHPPTDRVFSARNGADVFFAAYSKILDQWYLCANGQEEKIDTPAMLFLDSEYVNAHEKDVSTQVSRPTLRLREGKRKAVQFELAL